MNRNRCITAVFIAVLTCPLCWTFAREKTYQTGKLVSVESPETPFPLPLPSGETVSMPVHLLYRFEVRQGDVLYVGSCLKKDYPKAQWQTADEVQFRREKDKMYLKRPKGGELELHFLLSAKLDPDGKPVAVLDFAKKK